MAWTELYLSTPAAPRKEKVADPPGFSLSKKSRSDTPSANDAAAADGQREILMVKKSWDVALAPVKSLPMQAVMSYFSGSSIQIFSILMAGSLFWGPLKVLLSHPLAVFAPLDDANTHDRLFLPKVVFIAGQVLSIALGLVKLQYMGLLPTTTSDWLAWESYTPTTSWLAML